MTGSGNKEYRLLKMFAGALTHMAQLVGQQPTRQRVTGLMLVRAHAGVASSVPGPGVC